MLVAVITINITRQAISWRADEGIVVPVTLLISLFVDLFFSLTYPHVGLLLRWDRLCLQNVHVCLDWGLPLLSHVDVVICEKVKNTGNRKRPERGQFVTEPIKLQLSYLRPIAA